MRARRGSVLIEFAISLSLLVTVLAGVWQFGYSFYLYNALLSAVRGGARYASLTAYDAEFHSRVKNMVVYGDPEPAATALPVVPGLTPEQITVTEQFNGPAPERVEVRVEEFPIPTVFRIFTLKGKPRCSFNYLGRFTVP